jgi:tRNA A-37 threonylcarbamoyl transferase component Bud32
MSFSDRLRLALHHLLPKRVRYYLLERDMKKLSTEFVESRVVEESRYIERVYALGVEEPIMTFPHLCNEHPKDEELN